MNLVIVAIFCRIGQILLVSYVEVVEASVR